MNDLFHTAIVAGAWLTGLLALLLAWPSGRLREVLYRVAERATAHRDDQP